MIDARRQAWQNKLAGTYATYAWDAHLGERFLAGTMDQLTAERHNQ